jgi:hypothetical protein
MKDRQAQQAEELRKLKEELATERDRRQRLEEVISQGKK